MRRCGSSLASRFLSTPSARRATAVCDLRVVHLAISIHALCEEGDLEALRVILGVEISIHALCEEGDLLRSVRQDVRNDISIHALCEEGDAEREFALWSENNFYPRPLRGGRPFRLVMMTVPLVFLSTPSARRATWSDRRTGSVKGISIHALCEEGDDDW